MIIRPILYKDHTELENSKWPHTIDLYSTIINVENIYESRSFDVLFCSVVTTEILFAGLTVQ